LKNSTLFLLSVIVILIVCPLKASSSGEGRKSGITYRGPIGSLVYFVFALINVFAFAPVTRSDNADDAMAVSEADRHYAVINYPKAVVTLFNLAM
jgi:hypothetical protein